MMGSAQVRLVIFTTERFAFKYDRLVIMDCLEVESWYLTMGVKEVFQDKAVTV